MMRDPRRLNDEVDVKRGLIGVSGQLLSQDFVLSAGAVIFDQALNKVCLVQNTKGECFLPKGRKNVGENLERTALREAYEETGFRCRLLPATMRSSVTLVSDPKKDVPDVVRVLKDATEPVAISMRLGPDGDQKIIFWFLAVIDGTCQQFAEMENGIFGGNFYTFEDALGKLTFVAERELLKNVVDIVQLSGG